MKILNNKNILVRIANIKVNNFEDFNNLESLFYLNRIESIKIYNEIEKISKKLDGIFYKIIRNTNDEVERKSLINIKRKIYHKKNIHENYKIFKSINDEVGLYLDEYISLRSQYYKLRKEMLESYYISDMEVKYLIDIYKSNRSSIDKALVLSSKVFLENLSKFVNKSKEISNKNKNNVMLTLYKYLTRATYKTSPFSYFCYQGVAYENFNLPLNQLYIFDIANVKEISSISLAQSVPQLNNNFRINRDLWIDNSKIEILKTENINYRNLVINNRRTLVTISNDDHIEKFIRINKYKTLTEEEVKYEISRIFNIPVDESENSIMAMLEVGILENDSYTDILENTNPPTIKKIDLEENRNLKLENNDKKVYEDIFIKDKIFFNNELISNEEKLKPINKLSLIFDDSLILRNQFIEYIGESKEIKINDLLKILNDFYRKKDRIVNKRIEKIRYLRSKLYNTIERNFNEEKETIISTTDINSIYKEFNLKSNTPFSYTYFLQPISENCFVLNNIFSGYGRMYSKSQNINPDIDLEKLLCQSLDLKNNDFEYLDLYGIYGFNANVHEPFTKYTLDIENIWGGSELKDLFLKINYEKKYITFRLNGKKVIPVNVSSISSRMLPLLHQFLCDIHHIDTIDLDFNKSLISNNKIEICKSKITFVPRIKTNNIILSRNKWILNLELYDNETETALYSELLNDNYENLIPTTFYVKPMDVDKIENLDQMNDFFKPQFINLKLITSYKLLYKISKKSKFLILEECKPNSDDKNKYPGSFINTTYELGVESYFVPMENY